MNKVINQCVQWFTDNQSVVRILQVGSKKSHLEEEALKVLALITIQPDWIPLEENKTADYLRRIIVINDWMSNP